MKLIVQSFSDIITNSSSEVFISADSEELRSILQELGISFECFKTEIELREKVEKEPWFFMDFDMFNPYQEWWFEDIKKEKTPDECWEFFKSFYLDLLGKILINVDRDYLYQQEYAHNISILKHIKE